MNFIQSPSLMTTKKLNYFLIIINDLQGGKMLSEYLREGAQRVKFTLAQTLSSQWGPSREGIKIHTIQHPPGYFKIVKYTFRSEARNQICGVFVFLQFYEQRKHAAVHMGYVQAPGLSFRYYLSTFLEWLRVLASSFNCYVLFAKKSTFDETLHKCSGERNMLSDVFLEIYI